MRKNKAINSFRGMEDVQVILLGTQKAASGTNLIEASHIILMGTNQPNSANLDRSGDWQQRGSASSRISSYWSS